LRGVLKMATQELAKTTNGKTINDLLKMETVKKRFTEVTGKNPVAFTSAVLNVVNGNKLLKDCEPNSILTAAVMAASLNLQINPAFGEAYIVPFKGKASFQVGVHGYVQLALRTGQYKRLHAGVVHEGEIRGVNPLTGEFIIGEKISDEVVGYVAHFELVNGFEKTLYMTKAEVESHAKKYSQSYQKDKNSGWTSSQWTTNFDKMATKTVLKLLLRNWGVKSVEMQQAIQADFSVVSKDNFTYPDNNNNSVPREEFNITPSEDTEFVEEKLAEEETAEEDNPFENVDMETGEILTQE